MSASNPAAAGSGDYAPRRGERAATSAKTSTAATFALVFGVSGLISSLTVILSVAGLILGIVGVILAVVALKITRRPGVTGRSIGIAGLVLSALAVLIAIAFAAGVSTFLNDRAAVNRLQQEVEDLRDELPT
ncbi:hypothetical protein [Micromonospora sp. NPDC004704]